MMQNIDDEKTAAAFATSWNNLPQGSVYTFEQFEDWLQPLLKKDVQGKSVLELGCGNGSLLTHMCSWKPRMLVGVDLGASINSATKNMESTGFRDWRIVKNDLTKYNSDGFDIVYCIGVIHHLKEPSRGFESVIRNVKSGGRFHCWVYAREGNAIIIRVVDPIRKIVSKFPWWFTKYFIATPLVIPFFVYAKSLALLRNNKVLKMLPLFDYCQWIAKRKFSFFRHVAFDQLVTPQTTYITKETIQKWLVSFSEIEPASTYIIMRNGNSWKFGGKVKK